MNVFPNDLGGTHPLATWANKLLRASRSSSLITGRGYKLKATPAGTILEIEDQPKVARLPFTIYRTTSWLKYKVSTGYVINTGEPEVPTSVETEFTLTSGESEYWFYIDRSTTPEILTSATTLVWSTELIPIGWVDTNTYSSDSRSVITQFLTTNVFVPC